MTWLPKTLQDVARVEGAVQRMAGVTPDDMASTHPAGEVDLRGVPCCQRRHVPDDELVDVSGLPAGLVPEGVRYLCGGCRSRLVRLGKINRAELAQALGAPPEVVEQLAERVRRTGRS